MGSKDASSIHSSVSFRYNCIHKTFDLQNCTRLKHLFLAGDEQSYLLREEEKQLVCDAG